METKNQYVPRVNQIDAITLNKDITRMIRENLLENLQAISPVLYLKIQPELDLLIQSAIWFGSVGKRCSTFGQQLLVLAYDSERLTISRLVLHFCLTVLPSYIKKLEERRLSHRVEWLTKAIEYGENAALVLSVLNFFRFLKTGRKPTLIDFLLGLDYISLRHNQRRDIGYKYLTRELLWGGFMEILGLVLPIINFRKLQRVARNLFTLKKPEAVDEAGNSLHPANRKPKLTPTTTCVFCGERPTLPHYMGCEHIYCYYCLSANILTDSKFCCVACDTPVPASGIEPL
ncbi:peroxisome biogenesis factor 2 [Musca vetustissima]|uniref:peroxisome biogenesis factor 2 n=1 Tax=Musca vetustissima TaxID=27455 RepID=UPI002AB7021C|nr:peroxisome biogenesis factor 2 [Musca vetustissima]